MTESAPNRYERLIETIFVKKHSAGAMSVEFTREELLATAESIGVKVPKNPGDILYSFRYRTTLPAAIRAKFPRGHEWVILPTGRGNYRFEAWKTTTILPSQNLSVTLIPDSTPGLISLYALSDEQALLSILRYNRMLDIFCKLACYSLQNHLRTSVKDMGQAEIDEMYVGVDRRGVHYVLPVQAKGGKDRISTLQVWQDLRICAAKFPKLIAKPIGAQFLEGHKFALFEFEESKDGISVVNERHFELIPANEFDATVLPEYGKRLPD